MKYTTNLRIPVPEAADPPKGDEQMTALAERVDTLAVGLGFSITDTGKGQPLPAGAWTRIGANMDDEWVLAGWVSDADGHLTCPADGLYLVGFQTNVFGSDEGALTAAAAVNASGSSPNDIVIAGYGQGREVRMSLPIALSKNDVLTYWLNPGSQARNKSESTFWAFRLGDAPASALPQKPVQASAPA